MSIVLCTLALNEIEWLEKLWKQHKDWPYLVSWIFVEGADRVYATTNPHMVSPEGLSVDGTTEFLADLAKKNLKVAHVKYGFSKSDDDGQGKCEMRQRHLDSMELVKPDYFLILDADEFYSINHQRLVEDWMRWSDEQGYNAYCFRYRHVWHPPAVKEQPLLGMEVIGGFWKMPHCHGWKWYPGMKYGSNHMIPEAPNEPVRMIRLDRVDGRPECVHMGFCANAENRIAKHNYYSARGECTGKRRWYVESRAAWLKWQPGTPLPRGANVVRYSGPIPEVFK